MVKQILDYLGITDNYQLPSKLMAHLLDDNLRENLFNQLRYTGTDLYEDMFYNYFQEEHAERKKFKQDFTPSEVAKILNKIALKENDYIYEPAAGTGGVLIQHWGDNKHRKDSIFYVAEEISSRAIPMLIFNLAIRGVNGVVIQCDSINRDAEAVFLLNGQGKEYSDIIVMPYSKAVEKEFDIKFTKKPYIEYTPWHTRAKEAWDSLLTDKIEIEKITFTDLEKYDIITVTDRNKLLQIVNNPEDIKGEIIEIHSIKSRGEIARVTVRKEG